MYLRCPLTMTALEIRTNEAHVRHSGQGRRPRPGIQEQKTGFSLSRE